MGFSRQEYCSGLPLPSPGYLPDPGIEPRFPALQADSLPSEPPGKPLYHITKQQNCMDEEQISDCLELMIREGGQCGYKGVHGLGKPCYDETVVHLDCGDEPIHVIYMNT